MLRRQVYKQPVSAYKRRFADTLKVQGGLESSAASSVEHAKIGMTLVPRQVLKQARGGAAVWHEAVQLELTQRQWTEPQKPSHRA